MNIPVRETKFATIDPLLHAYRWDIFALDMQWQRTAESPAIEPHEYDAYKHAALEVLRDEWLEAGSPAMMVPPNHGVDSMRCLELNEELRDPPPGVKQYVPGTLYEVGDVVEFPQHMIPAGQARMWRVRAVSAMFGDGHEWESLDGEAPHVPHEHVESRILVPGTKRMQ